MKIILHCLLIGAMMVINFFPIFAVLMTANFRWQSEENLQALVDIQPNRPILVSEYWPGWFDHWFEPFHNTQSTEGKHCNDLIVQPCDCAV